MNIRGFPQFRRPVAWMIGALAGLTGLSGQTLINLGTQGKNVDFTNAPYTRPLKTGTSLPATCSTGDMYLNLAGAVGKNLYACTATNTWTLQAASSGLSDPGANGVLLRTGLNTTSTVAAPSGTIVGTTDTQTLTNKNIDASEITSGTLSPSRLPALAGDVATQAGSATTTLATVNSTPGTFGSSTNVPVITVNSKGLITSVSTANVSGNSNGNSGTGASTISQLLDFSPSTSGASATFGTACASTSPCIVYLNNTRFTYTNAVNVSVSGSNADTAYIYIDTAGNRSFGYNSANTYTSSNIALVSGITAFPAGTFPLYQCTMSAGAFTTCNDYRPILSKTTFAAGAGTSLSTSASGTAINVAQTIDYVSITNYTLPGTACGHYEIGTSASAGIWGLPTPSAGGMITNGCTIAFRATGGSITLAPMNATINGANQYVVASGQYCSVVSDGANYQVGQCSGTYNAPIRGIGYVFDGGGNPLSVGKTGYYTVPYSCALNSWNMTVDSGTATVDVWKVPSGAVVPTSANTITGSSMPSISAGTAVHSTNLAGWTTIVAPNDILGFNIKAVSGATLISLVLACQ